MTNLLKNPMFQGVYSDPDGQTSLVIPLEWEVGWLDKGNLWRTELQADGSHKVAIYDIYSQYGPRPRPGGAKVLKPEILRITAVQPYLDPPRIEAPYNTVTGFKGSGTICWWMFQHVEVSPGKRYRLTGRAHAWALSDKNSHAGDAHYSEVCGNLPYYALEGTELDPVLTNYRFRLGVDHNGGSSAFAPIVTWGTGIHIYNQFHDVPGVEFVATNDVLTIYIMVDNTYGFWNSNSYVSRLSLEEVVPNIGDELLARVTVVEGEVVSLTNALGAMGRAVASIDARVSKLEGGVTPPDPGPKPQPIPTIVYPKRAGSMIGLHVEAVGDRRDGKTGYGYGDWLKELKAADRQPSSIKGFLDGGSLYEAGLTCPNTLRVARWRPIDEDSDYPDEGADWKWDPAQVPAIARSWLDRLLMRARLDLKWIQYLEVSNEVNGALPIQFQNQNRFFLEIMKYADSLNLGGLKLGIGGFSSGCPKSPLIKPGEPDEMSYFVESIEYAALHGHILTVHDGSVNGDRPLFMQSVQDKTGLRYRYWKQMMDAARKPMCGIIITECYQPAAHLRGFDVEDTQKYLTDLAKDRYVLGMNFFTLGAYGFGGPDTMNIVGQLQQLAEIAKSLPKVED